MEGSFSCGRFNCGVYLFRMRDEWENHAGTGGKKCRKVQDGY